MNYKNIQNNIFNIIFALILYSSIFTNAYILNSPVRIFEFLVIIFALFTILISFINSEKYFYSIDNDIFSLIKFYGSIILIIYISANYALLTDYHSAEYFTHNILSFTFLFFFILLLSFSRLNHIIIIKIYTYIFTLTTILFFFLSLSFTNIYEMNLYHLNSDKLSLYARTPNQLAFFILPIPFFIILFFNFKKIHNLFFLIISLPILLIVGINTKSDSLIIAWIISISIFFIFTIFKKLNFRYARFIYLVIFIVLVILLTNGYFYLLSNLSGKYNYNDITIRILHNLVVRLNLLSNGILQSFNIDNFNIIKFLFGAGPGGSSTFNAKYFQGREAHNLFVDIFMLTGILGIYYFLLFIKKIVSKLVLKNNFILTALFMAILINSMFHFNLRQPMFGYYLLIIIIYNYNNKLKSNF